MTIHSKLLHLVSLDARDKLIAKAQRAVQSFPSAWRDRAASLLIDTILEERTDGIRTSALLAQDVRADERGRQVPADRGWTNMALFLTFILGVLVGGILW